MVDFIRNVLIEVIGTRIERELQSDRAYHCTTMTDIH